MFIRLGPRKHEFPVAALIPNLLTTVALCCGLAALHFATRHEWDRALGAVVLAGVFDALDGRAARLLRVSSGFGAVLDSLSDFLAFGIAPAMILHEWLRVQEKLEGKLGAFALAAFVTYALCAALRLARFTADAPASKAPRADRAPERTPGAPAGERTIERPATYFTGMPSPAAAGAVLIPPMLARSGILDWTAPAWVVMVYTLVIAVLMVTRVPMFSLKALRITRRAVVPLLVCVGLLAVGAAVDLWLTLSVLAALYVLSIPLTLVAARRRAGAMGCTTPPDAAPGERADPSADPAAR
ncbi:MAG: phosphatidylcholine/phosphatidylserine synthase [Planctomycetota bacterium]|nr:phosphatidylcholine/phosphatidylserine synthase [Planctomycetota bacterium]